MADYWALDFQMETQMGREKVYQTPTAWTWANLKLTDSRMTDYWALHLQMEETQTGWKKVGQMNSAQRKGWL